MRYALLEQQRDMLLLAARILMMALFVIFGWEKLTAFDGTVDYMTSVGAPAPGVAAVVAIVMEFFVAIALIAGLYTRPLAVLLALYTIATAFIGHHYWTLAGQARMENMINFYKNVSIAGGLLLLAASGPGRYSVDKR